MYKVMDFDSQKTGEKLNHSENVFHEALKKKLEYCHVYKDDQPLYEKMHQHYGKKLRAISQERFSVGEFKDVTLISELEKQKNTADEYAGAVEDTTVNYIYAIYVLSRCESLIGSGVNNGYNMAVSLNGGKYRRNLQMLVGLSR